LALGTHPVVSYDVAMSDKHAPRRKTNSKYRRARIRNFLFTVGPNRLSGGRISRRHLAQDIVVRDIEIASPNWPKAFDGLRIGHVSDFHLGELLPLDRALEVVNQLAQQEPDFIACTGDVVDLHHDEAGPLLDAMAKIDAPMGAALVLGNHDELHCSDTITRLAERAGMMMLRNSAVEVAHNGHHLTIGGIDWAKSAVGCAKHVDGTCGDGVDLLLAHNPRAFMRAAEIGIPLTLAGHTHGGQIAMKNRPNVSLAFGHRHRAGLFSDGASRLYVTVGVGAWFPLRVNCPAEIAMLTMKHVEEEPEPVESPKHRRRRKG
jgi:predicted MPP superfamily phosphohydrolase